MISERTLNQTPPAAGRILGAAGLTAIAGGSSLVWYFDPTKVHFLPVCPLMQLTGLACPGCGLTRGFHALFHGDVLTALDFNALLPVYVLIIGYFFISLTLLTARGRGLSFKLLQPGLLWGFLALSIAFAVLRNLPVYPFSILYP
jgi:Protein of unknown function (DUF2752)